MTSVTFNSDFYPVNISRKKKIPRLEGWQYKKKKRRESEKEARINRKKYYEKKCKRGTKNRYVCPYKEYPCFDDGKCYIRSGSHSIFVKKFKLEFSRRRSKRRRSRRSKRRRRRSKRRHSRRSKRKRSKRKRSKRRN